MWHNPDRIGMVTSAEHSKLAGRLHDLPSANALARHGDRLACVESAFSLF